MSTLYASLNMQKNEECSKKAMDSLSAKEIVRNDYRNIQANHILQIGGWVEIIKDNQVIHIIGDQKDNIKNYGIDNLPDLMQNYILDYDISMIPFIGENGEKYYCIVKIPILAYFAQIFPNINIDFWKSLMLTVIFLFVTNGCIIYYFIRRFSRPLKEIKNGIKSMTDGKTYVQLQFHASQEFEEIKNAFNYMVHKINVANEEKRRGEERKKKMLCDISHDIKTPMTSIIGYSKALVEQQPTQINQKLFASYIYRKSIQLDRLIQDLFDFAKLDSPLYTLQVSKTDLVEIIQETVAIYYGEIEEKKFKLRLAFPDSPVNLNLDVYQIARVIGNIIINTLKYNPEGTTVSISIEDKGETVALKITDNGIGIREEVKNCIFDEFVRGDTARGSDGGSGLGLAIAKKIVELHKGHITVDSKLNEGTTFTIIFRR
ncbi:HAMP domain-containing sensor histidine kinase [Bacillus thuringiensis]